MKFLVGNKIYSLGWLMPGDEEWAVRYTPEEGLVMSAPSEIDVMNAHGDSTGEKTVVWRDLYTVATGEDGRKLWETLRRVLASEKLAVDADDFLAGAAEFDNRRALDARALAEERRIQAEALEERLNDISGLSLAALRAKERGQNMIESAGPFSVGPGGRKN